ncbi:HPP family protein [Paenibacillus sp. UNCCL117]|uniref:HPP family protein n=1 Tax=unclassified Paenibacillus TaxID=185978 RepID=UPI0008886957|nr:MULTISPECIES: HPP family protein [unclassified Paenibacillus]SDE37584.1 HPP family protein [Paenibacillus sp. cl123]SFW64968.1 HPP family protein [Paenibacillus sp. UNCCL117]
MNPHASVDPGASASPGGSANSTPSPRGQAAVWLRLSLAAIGPGAGAFAAILAALQFGSWTGWALLMAPFGASCVLVFALPDSPLAQPRNVIGGHVLSTAIGLALLHTAGMHPWSAALGVGLAITLMLLTRTLHPPAGADPLVVMLGGGAWSFLGAPALAGAVWIVAAAWIYHRLQGRRYPQRWL